MKVTCIIDNLGSGGAQRQLCTLMALLKQAGWDVTALTYYPDFFFASLLEKEGIEHQCITTNGSKIDRVRRFRSKIRHGDQDVVLAFLPTPCFLAEVAALPWRKWGLVVSERLAIPRAQRQGTDKLAWLHHLADYVTANSHTNRLMLEHEYPFLRGRTVTIYNCVDLQTFHPSSQAPIRMENEVRLVAVASYQKKKNLSGVISALGIVHGRSPDIKVHLDWYGGYLLLRDGKPDMSVYNAALAQASELGLGEFIHLHPPDSSISEVYQTADALILPSFFEGLPNVVCEAMACGCPVLMSDVCDAGNLVKPRENGFLFDPSSSESIADAILEFCEMPQAERRCLGQRGREMAEVIFSPQTFLNHYSELLTAAANRRHVKLEHWMPEVPESALRTAGLSNMM